MVLMLQGESDGPAKSSCTHFVAGLSLSHAHARTHYIDKTINNVGVDPSKSNRSRIVLGFNTLRFFLLYIPVLKLTVSCPLLTRMSSINQLAIELLQLYYHVLGEELNKL